MKQWQRASVVPPVPGPCDPEDLIDGIIFAANYLGSTQLLSDKTPSKNIRMMQAQEAVSRIKVSTQSDAHVLLPFFIVRASWKLSHITATVRATGVTLQLVFFGFKLQLLEDKTKSTQNTVATEEHG